MKKNSIFSFKLYREGLHQIRVFALVPLIFMMIALAIGFASSCIDVVQNIAPLSYQIMAEPVSMNPLLSLTFFLCAPMLTLVLFQFLNKRNQSDFYHAIPQPRSCVAVSFLAAVLTWILVYAVVPTLCGAALYRVFLYQYMAFDMSAVFVGMLNVFVLSLLVISAVFLAMTVTGTLFSNGIVALLILFLPRFFMTVINAAFSFDIIPASSLAFPFGPFNMLFNLIFGVFLDTSSGLYAFDGGALLYTAVLALLYFALGLVLFKHRPSEAAGNPAPSRKIQAFHRIVLTCAVAFPLTLAFVSDPPEDAETVLLFVVGYIVAIIVYFMYELLSTRTARYMVKIIPGLLIVAAVCVAGTLLSQGFYKTLLNDVPKADDLQEIYIEGIGDYYTIESDVLYSSDPAPDYFREKVGELPVTDKACLTLASQALSDKVNAIKENKLNTDDTWNNDWAKIRYVCKNGHHVTRLVPVTAAQKATLQTALTALPAYNKVYTDLPAFKDSFATAFNGISMSADLTTEQRKEIYNTLRDELKTVDTDKWVSFMTSNEENLSAWCSLEVYVPQNGKTLWINLPISSLTSNTLKLVQQDIYKNFNADAFKKAMHLPADCSAEEFQNGDRRLHLYVYQNGGEGEGVSCSPNIAFFNENTGEEIPMTASEKAAKIKAWNDAVDYFADHVTAEMDMTKPYVEVIAEHYSYVGFDDYHATVFLPLDGATLPLDTWGLAAFCEQGCVDDEIITCDSAA